MSFITTPKHTRAELDIDHDAPGLTVGLVLQRGTADRSYRHGVRSAAAR